MLKSRQHKPKLLFMTAQILSVSREHFLRTGILHNQLQLVLCIFHPYALVHSNVMHFFLVEFNVTSFQILETQGHECLFIFQFQKLPVFVQNLKSMYTSGYLVCSFSAMPCQISSRVLSLDVSQKIGEPMKIRSC